ncbi:MAG: DEAD/DEAH box helicase family protein [Burkholderiales bacterium]|nr:DEAD/DEAH box helicase family protein [Burkholderiales bacterium]
MASQTNEQALEATIEKYLTGTCLEELKILGIAPDSSHVNSLSNGSGFQIGLPHDFDPHFAFDTKQLWAFLELTQASELAKLQRSNDWKLKILERLDRMIRKNGLLHVLRKGLDLDDAHFTLLYVLPLASSSQSLKDNFAKNQFSVTRQVRYSLANPGEEIDMAIFVNGLPLITMELKNPWTGQTAKLHGQKQYKFDRDTNQTLLNFARCLVHFVVDTEEIYMTTHLNGASTFFLPFNKGNNHGKGNPPNDFGYKTDYLWKEIFTRESLSNIIQHFVRLDGSSKDPLSKRTLFFPRYHQLDVVRQLINDVSDNGVGKTYLIQHSAGSGKSNSITWAAYQLIEAYPVNASVPGAKSLEAPLFDSVIVVTDRRLLDKQLRDNIREFSEIKNIMAPAYSSQELKSSLENGKKIIITTIQKFPFIVDGIADLSNKTFAVIIDEAHSSQSGSAADNMQRAMGNNADDDLDSDDPQDKILSYMTSRKMRGNASYFAFTATPKATTLEKFGIKQPDGKFKPFHLYSMKQAIEEGFILDVLANYTTYRSYYAIEKSVEDNPLFDTKKAQKKLRAYVERNKQTVRIKTEIMLEHFIQKVINAKKLKGKAKGMIITQNIEVAIQYFLATRTILAAQGHPFKALIAFSGTKIVNGIEYTEADLNGFGENETRDKFDTDEYRLLVVANKYLTGFDQPKLSAMYVDKKLQGVLAVQALSRLNRSADKLGKKTEDLFVLDFFNSVDDIKESFDPFYTATTLNRATDVNVLHELKESLDETGVYEWHEVENFTTQYFNNARAEELSAIIDVAANRFCNLLELGEEDKADYKIKAKQFVKIYGQMAAIIPYERLEWEQLFWFLKFLIPKLLIADPAATAFDELLETIDLSTYGLERVKLNSSIGLDSSDSELDPQNPNPRGAHGNGEEKDTLDEIISSFNQKWFQGWEATPAEQRVKFINLAESMRAHPDYKPKYEENHDPQTRDLAFNKIFDDVMAKHRRKELELYRMLAQSEASKHAFQDTLKQTLTRI